MQDHAALAAKIAQLEQALAAKVRWIVLRENDGKGLPGALELCIEFCVEMCLFLNDAVEQIRAHHEGVLAEQSEQALAAKVCWTMLPPSCVYS